MSICPNSIHKNKKYINDVDDNDTKDNFNMESIEECVSTYYLHPNISNKNKNSLLLQYNDVDVDIVGMKENHIELEENLIKNEEIKSEMICYPSACSTLAGYNNKHSMKRKLCEKKERNDKNNKYCLCDISQHTSIISCWLVAKGNVYDITKHLKEHPAGSQCILRKAKKFQDCSEDMSFHSRKTQKIWEKCKIGKLTSCRYVPNQTIYQNEVKKHDSSLCMVM